MIQILKLSQSGNDSLEAIHHLDCLQTLICHQTQNLSKIFDVVLITPWHIDPTNNSLAISMNSFLLLPFFMQKKKM